MKKKQWRTSRVSINGRTLLVKNIPPQMVAGIRFTGRVHQVGPILCTVYDEVKRYIRGKPMCLYHAGDSRKIRRDIEACFPVVYPVNTGSIRSHTLEGGTMLCMHYGGQNGSRRSPRTVEEAWHLIQDMIKEHGVPVTGEPARELYFVENITAAHDANGYVTELQVPVRMAGVDDWFMGDPRGSGEEKDFSFSGEGDDGTACIREELCCVLQR